jgi:hypothetical protein
MGILELYSIKKRTIGATARKIYALSTARRNVRPDSGNLV